MNHRRAQFECVVCGKIFEGNVQEKPKFCSPECVWKCRKEILANPDSPLSKYMTVKREKTEYTRVCVNCGKHFTTYSPKTANRQCPECMKMYSKTWTEKRKQLLANPKLFERDLDFALDGSGLEVIPGEENKNIHDAFSPHEMTQTREEVNARRRFIYAKRRALGLLPSLGTVTKQRNRIIEERGAACEICGWNYDVDGLQIHHIDADRNNNEDSNLIILCSCCHSVIHQRIKRKLRFMENKALGVIEELNKWEAEVKSRNEAGTPDGAIRTEGCE